jgi:hypothetical protein
MPMLLAVLTDQISVVLVTLDTVETVLTVPITTSVLMEVPSVMLTQVAAITTVDIPAHVTPVTKEMANNVPMLMNVITIHVTQMLLVVILMVDILALVMMDSVEMATHVLTIMNATAIIHVTPMPPVPTSLEVTHVLVIMDSPVTEIHVSMLMNVPVVPTIVQIMPVVPTLLVAFNAPVMMDSLAMASIVPAMNVVIATHAIPTLTAKILPEDMNVLVDKVITETDSVAMMLTNVPATIWIIVMLMPPVIIILVDTVARVTLDTVVTVTTVMMLMNAMALHAIWMLNVTTLSEASNVNVMLDSLMIMATDLYVLISMNVTELMPVMPMLAVPTWAVPILANVMMVSAEMAAAVTISMNVQMDPINVVIWPLVITTMADTHVHALLDIALMGSTVLTSMNVLLETTIVISIPLVQTTLEVSLVHVTMVTVVTEYPAQM